MQRLALLPQVRGIFSHLREYPPWTPKRTRGECPSTPDIAGLQLEELRALRSVGAVYVASPQVSANRYRYQPRLTIVRRE